MLDLLLAIVLLIGPGWRVAVEPQACDLCVTERAETASRFGRAPGVGLLAHDDLAGAQWRDLAVGDRLIVVDAFGRRRGLAVRAVWVYRATEPGAPWTMLAGPDGRTMSQDEVFAEVYRPGRLVLQTCEGGPLMGWRFVIAGMSGDFR